MAILIPDTMKFVVVPVVRQRRNVEERKEIVICMIELVRELVGW